MAQSAANPVDVDLFSSLHGSTEVQNKPTKISNPSTAFIQKSLHPPSAIDGYCGLPTNDARSQVLAEWRSVELSRKPVIPGTANIFVGGPASPCMAFLIPTGARVNHIAFSQRLAADTGYRYVQDIGNTQLNTNYNFANFRDDAQLYRPAYKSTTFYLNATYFNNTGLCIVNQFNPNVLFAGTLLKLSNQPELFMLMVKSRNIKHVPYTDMEFDTHSELFSTFPNFIQREIHEHFGTDSKKTTFDLNPNTTVQIVNFGTSYVVPEDSQVLMQSLRSYAGKAMDGAFVVQRLNTIAPQWLSAGNTIGPIPGDPRGLYECWAYNIRPDDQSQHLVPFLEPGPAGISFATAPTLLDTLWSSDFTWSWVVFDGLTYQNVGTGTASPTANDQILITKTYLGVEIQPAPQSPWTSMLKISPAPDLEAMQALMDGFYELKDGLPAAYNFWGTLAAVGGQILTSFGPKLLQTAITGLKNIGKKKNNPKPTPQPAPSASVPQPPRHNHKKGHHRVDTQVYHRNLPGATRKTAGTYQSNINNVQKEIEQLRSQMAKTKLTTRPSRSRVRKPRN
nr:hypothetical protein [Hepelivirales sp.]